MGEWQADIRVGRENEAILAPSGGRAAPVTCCQEKQHEQGMSEASRQHRRAAFTPSRRLERAASPSDRVPFRDAAGTYRPP